MNSSLTPETRASVPQLRNQYQLPLCGWSRDFEPSPVPHSIPSIPESMPWTLTPSHSNVGQHDENQISSLALETCASVPQLQNQYQLPLCGWSRDFEPSPVPHSIPSIPESMPWTLAPSYSNVGQHDENQYQIPLCGWSCDFEPSPVPHSILSIPESMPQTLAPSHSNMGQHDAWLSYALGGNADTCGDTALSASGSLGAFTDYDFPSKAHADPQPSIASTHNAMPSIQSTTLLCSEPTCGPNPQTQIYGCQWLANSAPCEMRVMADRRSITEHLQQVHGMKMGEEKARKTCLWDGCRSTLNKESLVRHIIGVHLKKGAHCAECGLLFAREDSLKRHLRRGRHKVPSGKGAVRQPPRNHVGFDDHIPDGVH